MDEIVNPTQTGPDLESAHQKFPIVGIGASAGGLASFEIFFSQMSANSSPGMAFVLVQHLARDHKSILSELIRRYTSLQVFDVVDGLTVEPNCVYIIPPNRDMSLSGGKLYLLEPANSRGIRLPIDFFFRSLAQDQRENAICIILSGTGSDGSLGARAVKGEGGMVMVQTPESTEYDGMCRSAIQTGVVDFVLTPDQMPDQLLAYVSQAFTPSLLLPFADDSPPSKVSIRFSNCFARKPAMIFLNTSATPLSGALNGAWRFTRSNASLNTFVICNSPKRK